MSEIKLQNSQHLGTYDVLQESTASNTKTVGSFTGTAVCLAICSDIRFRNGGHEA